MKHPSYLFIFGRTPDLAMLELQSFFPNARCIHPEVARVDDIGSLSSHELLSRLGGTVKIAREQKMIGALTADCIMPLFGQKKQNLHFGVSVYGGSISPSLLLQIKERLAGAGIRARYALARHGSGISSVTVHKSGLTELVLVKTSDGFASGMTEVVQDYEAWSQRDYGRPYADAKSGMLPPKVARMIVNIAGIRKDMTLLDPFCGMGTILAEGYMRGCRVSGADADEEAVRKARENLRWLKGRFPDTGGVISGVLVADAVHISKKMTKQDIHAIVTEPFMGSTDIANAAYINPEKIKNIIKGLEKLYIGCLREWSKVLIPGGRVIIALPEYSIGGRTYFVKKVIDMCENLGYTTQAGPIEYGRPGATVKRLFYIFKKI